MRRRVILASSSRHRRELLVRLGIGVETVAPECDERVVGLLAPSEVVRELARRKAESLGPRFPDALIVGADQVVDLDGAILGKPGDARRATEQLVLLAGREHRLLTGVCVHDPRARRSEVAVDVHRMQMRPLSEDLLRRYVDRDRPYDCAGAYRVEATGPLLFERMEGVDHTAIVGLPVCALGALLARFGVEILELVG